MFEVRVVVERTTNGGFLLRNSEGHVGIEDHVTSANRLLIETAAAKLRNHTAEELQKMLPGKIKTFIFTLS